jgi:hypothetical protein
MFDRVKREVVKPGKCPDGHGKQADKFPGRVIEDQQPRG